MSRARQIVFTLAAFAAFQIHAQNSPPAPGRDTIDPKISPLLPPKPVSPVAQFRELLAMTPLQRNQSLSNRSPETRARIQNKIREYLALSPDERELRLRATELRWYLSPLFRAAPADREPRLAQVPDDLRDIVRARLEKWDILPPPLQREFLESDRPVHWFAHVENTNAVALAPEQQRIAEQFNQFFEFTPEEKKSALGTLSETERAQMETTLKNFEQLPLAQRRLCLKNFTKFAGMAPTERAEFLKNAELWSKMSPQERKSWRDLVSNVPQWPPLPPAPSSVTANLMPNAPKNISRPGVATN